MLHGRFRFQGIRGVQNVTYTLSRGGQPSLCTLQVPYEPDLPKKLTPEPSTMFFTDGVRSVSFSKCVVNDISPSISDSGELVWQIGIVDRRWMWAFGQVSGEYNYPEVLLSAAQSAEKKAEEKKKGGKEPKSKRADKIIRPLSLRELCSFLLTQMKEKDFDVTRVPDDTYPYVNWNLVVPGHALDELCQAHNLHIVLTHKDKVVIYPFGESDADGSLKSGLPNFPSSSSNYGVSKGAIPDEIAVTSGEHLWQFDFKLVAYGKDRDNKFKPIDKLSYAPKDKNGNVDWNLVDPRTFEGIPSEIDRKLAKETVFRCYAIGLPDVGLEDGKIPGTEFKPFTVQQFLIKDYQLQCETVETTKELYTVEVNGKTVIEERDVESVLDEVPAFAKNPPARKKAEVFGVFYSEKGNDGNNVDKFDRDTDKNKKLKYESGFEIDAEKYMVKFSDPVFMFKKITKTVKNERIKKAGEPPRDNGTSEVVSYLIVPADIRLRAATGFRDMTRAFYRMFRSRKIVDKARGTPTYYVAREDIQPYKYIHPVTKAKIGNVSEVEDQLRYYLKVEYERWRLQEVANSTYPFLVDVSPNGVRTQVVFSIDGQGVIRTTVAVGEELITNLPKYEDRRKALQLARTLEALKVQQSKPKENREVKRIDG